MSVWRDWSDEMNIRMKDEILSVPMGLIIRSLSFTLFCFQFFILISCQNRAADSGVKDSLNRLALASSPYLREHADNPVDWYEWGSDALEKAKNEDKPIIISIGYASCHWCHVMERESFMDTAVARIMNENFVSIKIDREERPDIDQIYLKAAQLISGNGGWPLNAFALPDGKPFHAATYFPRDEWIRMLKQVISIYENEKENLQKQAEALTHGIQIHDVITEPVDNSRTFDQKLYKDIFKSWSSFVDESAGGLKGAPKFPLPVVWEHLLQHQYLTGDVQALAMVTRTLDKMALGGIHDQLGGGFSRYATDEHWNVPHFEKMLYDNGQMISLYAHAYQVTKKPLYHHVIEKTIEFIQRELTSPEGGFYSSVNADSENEEGKFYVWTKKEIVNVLDSQIANVFTNYYQVKDSGNWENGKNILYCETEKQEFAKQNGMTYDECSRILSDAEHRLLLVRQKRARPSVDDKILVSWNALTLKGYVDAYFALGNPLYLETALKNAQFLEKNMIRENGRLWRNYKDGKPGIDAFLDDYALLAKAFICLYQATFDIHWLDKAKMITEYAMLHFRDAQSGMFYYTSVDAANLIARKMELTDNVIPASNSVLAEVIYLLGEYYQEDQYVNTGRSMLSQVTSEMTTAGPYYAGWASLLGMIAYQPYEVAIVGEASLEKSSELLRNYLPTAIFIGGNVENLPLLQDKLVKGQTIIYVCRNNVCRLPEKDVARALKQLSK
jgi:uncharacterized protein